MAKFDPQAAQKFICEQFDKSALPALVEFIKIDNLSRSFDANWKTNGKLEQAAKHIIDWVTKQEIKGLQIELIKDQEFSPLIFIDIAGDLPETVFFYGHFDKQPPMDGWRQGLGATIPIIQDGKLYGRGGADDGYSTFSTILALKAIQEQKLPLPRCVMITEGDEESGSVHMRHYLPKLKERIGEPKIFYCLDSGTLDYDRLWLTNSLRGNLIATIQVQVLEVGLHSGDTSGVIPSCFRIAKMLLDRIENSETGEINSLFHVNVPPKKYAETVQLAAQKKNAVYEQFPFLDKVDPLNKNPLECLLNRNWRPSLTVIGQSGFPVAVSAGNVMRPKIEIKFSLRLPPTLSTKLAVKNLQEILTTDVPYSAKVQVKNIRVGPGWSASPYDQDFEQAIKESSQLFYKNKSLCLGQGGSIPLMGDLQSLWPKGQFLITGVLGPKSNAHGPNEFMHLDYTKKLTCCLAYIVAKTSEKWHKQ